MKTTSDNHTAAVTHKSASGPPPTPHGDARATPGKPSPHASVRMFKPVCRT